MVSWGRWHYERRKVRIGIVNSWRHRVMVDFLPRIRRKQLEKLTFRAVFVHPDLFLLSGEYYRHSFVNSGNNSGRFDCNDRERVKLVAVGVFELFPYSGKGKKLLIIRNQSVWDRCLLPNFFPGIKSVSRNEAPVRPATPRSRRMWDDGPDMRYLLH